MQLLLGSSRKKEMSDMMMEVDEGNDEHESKKQEEYTVNVSIPCSI